MGTIQLFCKRVIATFNIGGYILHLIIQSQIATMEYYIYLAFKCFTILINFTHGLASGFVVVGSLFIVASNVFCLYFLGGGGCAWSLVKLAVSVSHELFSLFHHSLC